MKVKSLRSKSVIKKRGGETIDADVKKAREEGRRSYAEVMLEYLTSAIAEGRPKEEVYESVILGSLIQATRDRVVMDTLLNLLERKGVFTREDRNELRKTVVVSMQGTENRLKEKYPTYFEGMKQLEETMRGHARERLRDR